MLWGLVLGHLEVGNCSVGAAGIFSDWALQAPGIGVGCGKETLGLSSCVSGIGQCKLWGIAGILCGWKLQGHSALAHCRDTLRLLLGTVALCGWALLDTGFSAVGRCRDTPWLDTPWGGHCMQGEESMGLLNANNPL